MIINKTLPVSLAAVILELGADEFWAEAKSHPDLSERTVIKELTYEKLKNKYDFVLVENLNVEFDINTSGYSVYVEALVAGEK